MMFDKFTTYEYIENLFNDAQRIDITNKSKIVFFSDTHLGDGSKNDDFKKNSLFFNRILEDYYYKQDFSLVLNGDIEELQKFSLTDIRDQWAETYKLFNKFQKDEKLYKTIGNHDSRIYLHKKYFKKYNHHDALVLKYGKESLFVLHGHQFSAKFTRHNDLIGWILKHIAIPLGIMNSSVAHNSRKKFAIEKLGYNYSVHKNILTIIGHTHRPLFESMSKIDTLKYRIEHILRHLHEFNDEEKKNQEEKVKQYNKEIVKENRKKGKDDPRDRLYSSEVILPTLFNSGCVIGKRGVTALEICNGCISLVHWVDEDHMSNNNSFNGYESEELKKTPYYKITFKKEPLEYIFNKIRLLS